MAKRTTSTADNAGRNHFDGRLLDQVLGPLWIYHLLSASDGEAGTADVLNVLTIQNFLYTVYK